jgi:staphylococcal nuclease domain-containing protein 1
MRQYLFFRAKEPREDPYRHEAQEFLRQRLIGKTVSVHVEFVKPAQDNYPEKHCATVRLNDV